MDEIVISPGSDLDILYKVIVATVLALTLCHHFGSLGCHQIRGTLGRKNRAPSSLMG